MIDQLNNITDPNGCPFCGSSNVKAVGYTWWGGIIGPKLMHHTKCADCRETFNSKTRRKNTNAIIIYSVVVFVIAIAVVVAVR